MLKQLLFVLIAVQLCFGLQAPVSLFVNPCNDKATDAPWNNGTNSSTPLVTIPRALSVLKGHSGSFCSDNPTEAVIYLFSGCIYEQEATLKFSHSFSCRPGITLPITVSVFDARSDNDVATISGAQKYLTNNQSTIVVSSPTDVWDLWTSNNQRGFDRLQLATSPLMHYQHINHSYDPNATCFIDANLMKFDFSLEGELKYAYVRLYQSWTSSHNRIHSFDPTTGRLCLAGVYHGHFLAASGNRYYIQNAAYDEWNQPTASGRGSFYFTSVGQNMYKLVLSSPLFVSEVFVPQMATVVALTNVSNVHFSSQIKIAHSLSMLTETCLGGCGQSASDLRTAALEVEDSTHVSFTGVRVENTGSYGVWFHENVHFANFTKGLLNDLGCGGVRIGEPRIGRNADEAAVASNVRIADNQIQNSGHTIEAGCGVLLQQAQEITVTHNTIHDLFYTGISTGWDWGYSLTSNRNLDVSFNWIFNIGRNRLSDMGCIYNLGISPGTVFSNNLCHDVYTFGYGGWGFYSDQATSDVVWEKNIAFRTKGAGYHHHFGLNVTFTNNIVAHPFAINATSFGADSSGIRSSQDSRFQLSSFVAFRNIVLIDHDSSMPLFGTQTNSFNNVTLFDNVYWSSSLLDPFVSLKYPPRQKPVNFSTWQEQKDKDSVVADPMFCPRNGGQPHNYTCLEPRSPALRLGFAPIDMSDVGARL